MNNNDLISRKAAIEAMEKSEWGYLWECEQVINVVKDLPPTEPEQKWIPVSERLPDIGEYYVSEVCLCYCSNGAYCFGELEANIFGQVGWDCERDDDYHEPVGEVVAWMPLPEPYKEAMR